MRAHRCHGHNYVTIRLFCEPLSLCPRTHSFRRDDADMIVFCFAERDHTEKFREHFGGELIDPIDPPKWPGSHRKIVKSCDRLVVDRRSVNAL